MTDTTENLAPADGNRSLLIVDDDAVFLQRLARAMESRGYQVQVAELISLVPGTVVVELVRSPRRLYLHVLDLEGEHAIDDIRQMVLETERRVLRAFGTAQEREAFEAACVQLPPDSARTDEWEMEE